MRLIRFAYFAAVVSGALMAASCAGLQPLPASVYESTDVGGYEQLDPPLQSTKVDLLYLTDRMPVHDDEGNFHYGVGRSQSSAFGSVIVDLDSSRSWEELLAWTRSEDGSAPPTPEVLSVTELGRFPETPFPLTIDDDGQVVTEPEFEEEHARVRDAAVKELRRRLASTDDKRVSISVHGVGWDFDKGARVIAMAWHLRGRRAVPIYYSWPAGQGGFIRGYSYDRESGEFTIFHLKQLLRAVARVPEVEEVVLFAHSRGTDVLVSALRELIIEARSAGVDPQTRYKIGQLILMAPDMDMEVITQRVSAEGVIQGVGHVTVYVSDDDWAIGFAQSLFSSKKRLGQLNPESMTERQLRFIRKLTNVDIIFYKGGAGGGLGHSYYEAPEVISDIVMLLEGRQAGAEHGRPLEPVAPHLWVIRSDYAP